MKKFILGGLMAFSTIVSADEADLYFKIATLSTTVGELRANLESLGYRVNQLPALPIRHIGERYQGGLVFYVDESKQHGLIVSLRDLNNGTGIQWRNGDSGNKTTNARGDGIGAGEGNTRLIIAQQTPDAQNGQFAALLAANYRVMADGETPCPTPIAAHTLCYGNWYLPSAYELTLLQQNLGTSGFTAFAPDYYWSSTEASATLAWMQNFSSGEISTHAKSSTLGQVRAVRQF